MSIISFLVLRVLTSPLNYHHSSAPIIYMADFLVILTGRPAIREIQARRGGGKMGNTLTPPQMSWETDKELILLEIMWFIMVLVSDSPLVYRQSPPHHYKERVFSSVRKVAKLSLQLFRTRQAGNCFIHLKVGEGRRKRLCKRKNKPPIKLLAQRLK